MSNAEHNHESTQKGEHVQMQVPRSIMQVSDSSIEENLLKSRRNKVLERLSMGLTQREIANELDVHESTISRDIAAITDEIYAQHDQWVKYVFRENQIALEGLSAVLKDLWEIARNPLLDVSDRMKSYLLIMHCYNNKLTTVYNRHFIKNLKRQYEDWLEKEGEHSG